MAGDDTKTQPEPIFLDLATECNDPSVTEIETLCMRCYEKGTTRLLLTEIPHFRQVMVSSFSCPHCQHSDSSLLNAGAVQDRGMKITFKVTTVEDLRRMVVKSDTACIKIPEVELEIPKAKGEITNVEGILQRVCDGLQMQQENRRGETPALATQIDDFIARLQGLKTLETPFRVEINDPAGNSHVESLVPGHTDTQLTHQMYDRTPELNEMLALATKLDDNKLADVAEEAEEEEEADVVSETDLREHIHNNDTRHEVFSLDSVCERCGKPVDTRIKLTDIPHFKEVLVMGTACDHCGHKTREVKSGGGMSEKGRKITLDLTDHTYDLQRDVLKSDTCSVEVKELELDVGAGILGGKFTTVEGLLRDIKEDMSNNEFFTGDSIEKERKEKVTWIFEQLDKVLEGSLRITLILDDPAGNSYLQNLYAPDPDPGLTIEDYERTDDQDESLGLSGMKTEDYGEEVQ